MHMKLWSKSCDCKKTISKLKKGRKCINYAL